MKKVLSFVLVAVLCLSLAGCASRDEPIESTTISVAQSSEKPISSKNPVSSGEVSKEPEATKYSAGQYKVGTDIPAGEYVAFCSNTFGAYIAVTTDSTGELDSIITNDNFSTHIYITVSDGQYIEITSGYLSPESEVAAYSPTDGVYEQGMYKVGKDIAAGEYKVVPDSAGTLGYGYYEVTSNSLGVLDSIVSNDNFEAEKYVTIAEGQYIKLSNATLIAG